MIELEKYRIKDKIRLPIHIIKNMQDYIWLFGYKTNFLFYTSTLNIYLPNGYVISYYSTKNYALVFKNNRKMFSLNSWLAVLRFLSVVRGKNDY